MTLGKPLHVHPGLLGYRALSQFSSFNGKVVLKRPFLCETREAFAVHVHCSGLPGDSFELIK